MMNNIKKFTIVTLFVFILLVTGCIEKSVVITDKNVVEQSAVDSELGRKEDKIDGSNGIESTKSEYKVEFEYIDNLDELEIEDLNSDDIRKVILQLPNKWHARCVFRRHPDTDSGNIRTAYRNYPDSISGTSGHLVELTN